MTEKQSEPKKDRPGTRSDPPRERRRVGPEDEERGQQTDCENRHDD